MSLTMLAAIAQFERSQISQRTSVGREEVARQGKWLGGPAPYGYVFDDQRHLILSTIPVPILGCTEADLMRQIFIRTSQGETLNQLCYSLNSQGHSFDFSL